MWPKGSYEPKFKEATCRVLQALPTWDAHTAPQNAVASAQVHWFKDTAGQSRALQGNFDQDRR